MNIILVLIFAILIGSFLNVCIYRIPNEKSIIFPASSCCSCGHKLLWKDLIPVISYVSTSGNCRYCKEKISIRYPFIEIITGILILILYLKFGSSIKFLKYSILTLFLIVISFIDYDTKDVYSITTIPAIVIGFLFVLIESYSTEIILVNYIRNILIMSTGFFISGSIIGIICYLTGAMGEGDIEIAAASGIYLGSNLSIFMLIFSFIIGSFIALVLIITKRKCKNDYIAFGPSIAISSYLMMFIGNEIFSYYINLL